MNKNSTPLHKMTGACMRGGIDIDEDEMKKLPDANYWRMGAEWARVEMFRVLKTGYSDRICVIMDKYFWKPENTWMTICLRAEHMLDLINALKTQQS